MGERRQFRLPDVGEGLTEAEIVRWHVRPGDLVEVNQIIVEVETAKAVVELPCPFAGTVAAVLVEEGVTADVGTPIITVTVNGTAAPAPDPEPDCEVAPPADPERVPMLVGYGAPPPSTTHRRRRTERSVDPAGAQPEHPDQKDRPGHPTGGVLATPPVRAFARNLGVELASVTGTGPRGSITRADIRRAAGRLGDRPGDRETRIPVTGVRRITAEAMVRSAFTAPHFTAWSQVDVTEAVAAVGHLRAMPDFDGIRVTPLLLVARALLLAARRHPTVNASWDESTGEIVVKHYVNLGIAVATERGLLVPTVKDADTLRLPELARALAELIATARAGHASPRDLSDGTITITNVGVFGVDGGTPILSPGETAILALGQIRNMPWVHHGELAVRKVATLSLSLDHRVVDGDVGSAVLREVGTMLTDPTFMALWS